jgi:hypothetical protein
LSAFESLTGTSAVIASPLSPKRRLVLSQLVSTGGLVLPFVTVNRLMFTGYVSDYSQQLLGGMKSNRSVSAQVSAGGWFGSLFDF